MPDVVDEAAAVEAPLTETIECAPGIREQLLNRSVGSALTWLALPVLGEQVLNLLVGMTDFYLAGTINKEATVALGLAIHVAWLVWLLFSFIGAGATALVSRHAGEGSTTAANHFSNQALSASLGLGVIAFGLVQVGAPSLPALLGWDPGPSQLAVTYLRIESIGYLLVSLSAIGFACLRGMGDTRTPLYVMAVVNVVNVVVSAALVFGWGPVPTLGIAGIAIGTVVARILGGLIVLVLLIRGCSGLKLHRREMRPHWASLWRLTRIGLPAGADGLLMWAANFAFMMIISKLATGELQAVIVAAHFVGIRIEALSYLPAFAYATAAATLVGQSLGAGQPDRARHSGHLAAVQGAAFCVVMGVGYFVFAGPIYTLFNSSEDLAAITAIGVPALRLLAFFQIPLALMIIYANALRGAGDTRYPLIFTIVGMLIFRLPLAYVCGITLHGGLVGAWIGMCVDMAIRALLNGIRFARGQWQHIQV